MMVFTAREKGLNFMRNPKLAHILVILQGQDRLA